LTLCRRNLHLCSPQIKENAYKSIIRPHLEYASPAWNPHTSRNINKLEAVQRRAARFVMNDYNYGPNSNLSDNITKKLKWLPLQHRRAIYNLSMFYKIKNNLVNISFPSTVQLSYRSDVRYNRVKILHSDAYKYSFYCSTIRIWNMLPMEILDAGSIEIFKAKSVIWMTPLHWEKVCNTWTLV